MAMAKVQWASALVVCAVVLVAGAAGAIVERPPCGAEDKADFKLCLFVTAWARGTTGVAQPYIPTATEVCAQVPRTADDKARCVRMFVAHAQDEFNANPRTDQLVQWLRSRTDESFCWAQLTSLRAKAKAPAPEPLCRAETLSGKPRCVFFHGVGEKGPAADFLPAAENGRGKARSLHPAFVTKGDPAARGKPYALLKEYWGETAKLVGDQCEPYFFWTETTVSGWDKLYLENEYCGVIESLFPAAIFTHSMANLVVSAGLINKIPGCELVGRFGTDVRWNGLQGPLQGATPTGLGVQTCPTISKSSLLLRLVDGRCDEKTGTLPSGYGSMVLGYVSTEPGNTAQLSCKHLKAAAKPQAPKAGTGPLQPTLPAAADAKAWAPDRCLPLAWMATAWMDSSLCGLDPGSTVELGKGSGHVIKKKLTGYALKLLAKLTNDIKPEDADFSEAHMRYPVTGNDGMVGASSCMLYNTLGQRVAYGTDPLNKYYAFKGNHADGTCRFSDHPSDRTRQSCAWIVGRVAHVLQERADYEARGRRTFATDSPSGLSAAVKAANARIKAAAAKTAAAVSEKKESAPAPVPASAAATAVPKAADKQAEAVIASIDARSAAQEKAIETAKQILPQVLAEEAKEAASATPGVVAPH